jgi:hypothetical protein
MVTSDQRLMMRRVVTVIDDVDLMPAMRDRPCLFMMAQHSSIPVIHA